MYHNKVTLSLTPVKRFGNQARNCKMDYCTGLKGLWNFFDEYLIERTALSFLVQNVCYLRCILQTILSRLVQFSGILASLIGALIFYLRVNAFLAKATVFFFLHRIGDYESGIETLVGAISLIKQSPTAAEERCQVNLTVC